MKAQNALYVAVVGLTVMLAGCWWDTNTAGPASTLSSAPPPPPPPTLGTVTTTLLPSGQLMSPLAAPGATYTVLNAGLKDFPTLPAGWAETEVLSPDGKTLLILTTGYNDVTDNMGNTILADSNQYVFVYNVSGATPVQTQIVQVSDSYVGIAFSPDSSHFYVPGAGEDNVHVFAVNAGTWAEVTPPIPLGHKAKSGNGINQPDTATGIAVTADGTRALVANRYHDSVSIINLATNTVTTELDLRPGKNGATPGTPGGEYPNWIAIVGNNTAYVSSERDREIVVLNISGNTPSITTRIPVSGNPNKMILNNAQTTLYVASDNADVVTVINTANNTVTTTIPTVAPSTVLTAAQAAYKGASPDGLALSPDQNTLYVTNRGTNSVAVIALNATPPAVTGLIPTGWYPSDVKVSSSGTTLYISNAKTIPGPNPGNCLGYSTVPCPVKNTPVTFVPNEYIENLTGSAFQTVPIPSAAILGLLTTQVATNNNFGGVPSASALATMASLKSSIKHIIYIIKENRTYDQILGDLPTGNGDSALTEFPQKTTPNLHALASGFIQLDNYYDVGEVSGNGWPWSTSAKESDAGAKMLPPNYADFLPQTRGGGSYDWEGTNRNMNVGLGTVPARLAADPLSPQDPDVLPGAFNVAAPDGPGGQREQGYLWNSALRAGLTVRNYGFFIDLTRYNLAGTPYAAYGIAKDRTPFADNSIQAYASHPDLVSITDQYYRGFDTGFPDFYREQEWEREFNNFVTSGNLPALTLVRMMGDHTGSYSSAIDGVNAPDIQVADNDYAVGRLVQVVAKSPYASNTMIFITEDDAQDGPDHVDAHRSTAYVIGPYVKQGGLVSTHYTTVNMLRTITDILGIDHLSINDSNSVPMADIFDLTKTTWNYTAVASALLHTTQLPLPQGLQFASADFKPTHSAKWWAAMARGMDFSSEDKVDSQKYNRILWAGLMGGKPYPVRHAKSDHAADRQRQVKAPTASQVTASSHLHGGPTVASK